MRAAPPRGGITTPSRLSRFPGSRLGLLSAPSHPAVGGTVARADFNAAHSCGAAMALLRGPRRSRLQSLTIFPRGSPGGDHSASPIHFSGNILHVRDDKRGAICSRRRRRSQALCRRRPAPKNSEGTPHGMPPSLLEFEWRRTRTSSRCPSSWPSSRPYE